MVGTMVLLAWASFIGTSADPDMDDIATGGGAKEKSVAVPEVEDEEEDPFDTVNKLERKTRPKKKRVVEIPDEEEDVDDFGFDDDEPEAATERPKRKITRKPAARKVGRKAITRKKD